MNFLLAIKIIGYTTNIHFFIKDKLIYSNNLNENNNKNINNNNKNKDNIFFDNKILLEKENVFLIKDIIKFYKEILKEDKVNLLNVELENIIKKLIDNKPKKTIHFCINLFISSIFMIISAILLFLCREYKKNWKYDMIIFYLMESFCNTSIIIIPFFSLLLSIEEEYYIFGQINFLHKSGLVFSFFSIIFKLYLLFLSFSDYFEYEEYLILKKKTNEEQ
jgi:hypothetical protein